MPQRNRVAAAPAAGGAAELTVMFSELVRLETELRDAVAERLRDDHGVSLSAFEFIQVISRVPGCRVQDIAASLSITVGGTSKIVDRIEAAGLCSRRANPGDRRSSIIELTPAGKRLLARAAVTVEDELRRRLGTALPAERSLARFTRTLTRLRAAVRAAGGTARTTGRDLLALARAGS